LLTLLEAILTKSPIAVKPQFNPMIGPSNRVLIVMGARYQPCMRSTHGVQDSNIPPKWPCPNTTTTDENSPDMMCTLSQVCGFRGVPEPVGGGSLDDQPQPNQWFRFIIPIFLHAGIIHIAFNMLLQLTLGRDMEKIIGPWRFAVVYFSSGIFGFVLGGNYASAGQSSSGASGCLFGIIALILLDLLYTWKARKTPFVDLAFIAVDVAVCFVLGLLPGLDNFSHIGGFLMGLGLGVCLLHSPNALRERIGADSPNDLPYVPVDDNGNYTRESVDSTAVAKANAVARKRLGFFKGRKPLWWVWWGIRAAALIGVLVAFVVLLNNFYTYRSQCSWCKYLSCLVCHVRALADTPPDDADSISL
jgi:membrane associated rhomboid family serine protease